ncbi:dTMP kinase [Limibaculum sp. M0105]|uniref:Thymidylate kinase n=1 Tax=Thermohalobaculum xanthum TaxID=2753746 RepID=A0A8J7M596_9RHOB|nr:dTMP kinase [Thermohalobaculum xanthum]MBK0398498.1 dTMP kinase [Thermohalobaculum xanthum]
MAEARAASGRGAGSDQGSGGVFITLEGIDGTGKSTQARLLAERLRAFGRDVVLTREPGGAPGAEEIRRLLVEGEPGRWSSETETLLFTAARRDHLERVIAPGLARGAVVICDRFADSTRAYQGLAGGSGRDFVDRLHALAIGIEPDLTLILELAPDTALARASSRSDASAGPREDRFERKGADFQSRLAAAFRDIAAAAPERCHLIDANAAPDEVAARIWARVERLAGAMAP